MNGRGDKANGGAYNFLFDCTLHKMLVRQDVTVSAPLHAEVNVTVGGHYELAERSKSMGIDLR